MKTETNKKMIGGYIMAGVGFAFILYSAINYLFGLKLDWDCIFGSRRSNGEESEEGKPGVERSFIII
jgi:hypothetical protein